jgi:hypothetical protein
MQCDICLRTGGQKLPFLCPTDARNQLYEPRIQHAQVLVEKDALDQQISSLLASRPGASVQDTDEPGISRPHVDSIITKREQAEDRTQQIIAHADELRANIEKAREDIARRKAAIGRRRAAREAAANGIEGRRTRVIEEIEKGTRMSRYKWNQAHSITASSRAFLCGEAAKLYGLRRVKRGGGLDEYRIGGVGIVDLRAMNSELTTSRLRYHTDPIRSCQPSSDIDLFVSHSTSSHTLDALPGDPPPRRDHAPASRLPPPHHLPPPLILQARECPHPRHGPHPSPGD